MTTVRRTVGQLPSGRWRARYLDPTTGKWCSAGTYRTKKDAREALEAIATEFHAGKHVPAERSETPFKVYADDHFWPLEAVDGKTLDQQKNLYRSYVVPRWGDVPIGKITIEDVERWARVELPRLRLVRFDRTLSTSTIHQVYFIFHKIMAKAIERGWARPCLPRRPGLPKVQPTRPKNALTAEEVEHLAATVGKRHGRHARVLIYTLAYGGFRIGEGLALRREDIDFQHCEIAVDEKLKEVAGTLTVEKLLKTTRSHRSVPMPMTVIEMLADLAYRLAPRDFLFPAGDGGPQHISNFRKRIFKPSAKSAGFPTLTPHELRHTAASAWFDEGFDIVEVARMLGDSVRTAEGTYVHLYRGRRPERMAALDARIARGKAPGAESGGLAAS